MRKPPRASIVASDAFYAFYFDSGEGDDVFEFDAGKVVVTGEVLIRSGFPFDVEASDNDRLTINSGSFHAAGVTFVGSGGD